MSAPSLCTADDVRPFSPSGGSVCLFCSFLEVSAPLCQKSLKELRLRAHHERLATGASKRSLCVSSSPRTVVRLSTRQLRTSMASEDFLCDSRRAAIWVVMRLCSERTALSQFQRLALQHVAKDWRRALSWLWRHLMGLQLPRALLATGASFGSPCPPLLARSLSSGISGWKWQEQPHCFSDWGCKRVAKERQRTLLRF